MKTHILQKLQWKIQENYSRIQPNELAQDVEDAYRKDIRDRLTEKFEKICNRNFKRMLRALKEVGYEELWVGSIPHEDWHQPGNDMIFAIPTIMKPFPWPAVWGIAPKYFPTSCGNGLKNMDQQQLSIKLPDSLSGRHEL